MLVFIIDDRLRVLLLRSPRRTRGWEIVNGGLEAGETLVEGVAREVAEEAGPDVGIDVLGTAHSMTWRYDDLVPHMISTFFVARYLGGEVVPGDDMAGSEIWWATLDEVRERSAAGDPLVPGEVWIFERAFAVAELWWPR